MKKEHHRSDLQHPSLRKQAFRVPAGYFEGFPERLKERIDALEGERVPVRRLGRSAGFRIAVAAALVGLALISIPLTRIITPGMDSSDEFSNIALLEEAGVFYNDYELAPYLHGGETVMGEEEAYLNQAMDYLAMNDVEMDLIFE